MRSNTISRHPPASDGVQVSVNICSSLESTANSNKSTVNFFFDGNFSMTTFYTKETRNAFYAKNHRKYQKLFFIADIKSNSYFKIKHSENYSILLRLPVLVQTANCRFRLNHNFMTITLINKLVHST